jgi:hypothetical protein
MSSNNNKSDPSHPSSLNRVQRQLLTALLGIEKCASELLDAEYFNFTKGTAEIAGEIDSVSIPELKETVDTLLGIFASYDPAADEEIDFKTVVLQTVLGDYDDKEIAYAWLLTAYEFDQGLRNDPYEDVRKPETMDRVTYILYENFDRIYANDYLVFEIDPQGTFWPTPIEPVENPLTTGEKEIVNLLKSVLEHDNFLKEANLVRIGDLTGGDFGYAAKCAIDYFVDRAIEKRSEEWVDKIADHAGQTEVDRGIVIRWITNLLSFVKYMVDVDLATPPWDNDTYLLIEHHNAWLREFLAVSFDTIYSTTDTRWSRDEKSRCWRREKIN